MIALIRFTSAVMQQFKATLKGEKEKSLFNYNISQALNIKSVAFLHTKIQDIDYFLYSYMQLFVREVQRLFRSSPLKERAIVPLN